MVTDSRFQPGALVRDNRSRVGRVAGEGEVRAVNGEMVKLVPVVFRDEEERRPEHWLSALDPDSPEALLLDRPGELASWADEAPLRLVALALAVDGGEGRVSDVRARLHGRVIDPGQWDNWWKKRTRALGNLPDHFQTVKGSRGNEYRLLSDVGNVPRDLAAPTKSRPVPMKAWREWLASGSPEDVPGRYPTKPVAEALAKWDDAGSIEDVLIRLAVTAESVLGRGELSAQDAGHWQTAIAHGAIRRQEIGGADPRGYIAARAGDILARLARVAEHRTPLDLLLRAGALDGETDAWRRGFLAGMWDAFEGDNARDIYAMSTAVLGRQARGDLARQLFLSAFGPEFSDRRHSGLDRLLDALPEAERTRLLQEAIASAAPDQRDGVLRFIASSRHATGPENLQLRIVASMTLDDGQSDFAGRTSEELAGLFRPRTISVDASPARFSFDVPTISEQGVVHQRPAILDHIAGSLEQALSDNDHRTEELLKGKDAELEQERTENERLRQQVRERNAELAARREESRLEIRQDMLLAAGEVLQSVHSAATREELARSVEAGLSLALRAGGAEPLEQAGAVVEFDPALHESSRSTPTGGRVRVLAPGVVVRGGVHGDRVLLKAQVTHEEG